MSEGERSQLREGTHTFEMCIARAVLIVSTLSRAVEFECLGGSRTNRLICTQAQGKEGCALARSGIFKRIALGAIPINIVPRKSAKNVYCTAKYIRTPRRGNNLAGDQPAKHPQDSRVPYTPESQQGWWQHRNIFCNIVNSPPSRSFARTRWWFRASRGPERSNGTSAVRRRTRTGRDRGFNNRSNMSGTLCSVVSACVVRSTPSHWVRFCRSRGEMDISKLCGG